MQKLFAPPTPRPHRLTPRLFATMTAMTSPEPARADLNEWLTRQLFQQAPGFMAVLEGSKHTFVLANAAYDQLVGHRELIGRTVADAFPEVIEQGFIEMLDGVLASGEPHVGKRVPLMLVRNVGAAPEMRHVDFVYQPMRDAGGRIAGVFVKGHDVTDHVETLRRIDEQTRAFDGMLSSIDDLVFTFDRRGRFIYANKRVHDLLGLGLDAIVGKTFFQLPYPAPLAKLLAAQIEHVFQSRERVRGDTFFESPGGHRGWYEYVFSPVFDGDGGLATVAGSSRDVTSRVEQEQKLAALNESERAARASAEAAGRAKDDFLATLSHELRTPLNAILGWSELLRSGRLSGEQAGEAAERITRNARAQAKLIADLLDVNGIATGKVRLALERVPLARLVAAALDALRPDALAKHIALQRSSSDDAVLIDCDPDRLQQVLWNLLSNAVKFTPAGGRVSIDVRVDAATATITVADSGVGLASKFLPRLFKRFSQADSSSTRRYGGLGLGLAICKSLVDLHHGRIEAHSEGDGRGSTFVVTLPLQQPHTGEVPESTWGELPSPAQATQAVDFEGARILIVDDDDEGRELVVSLLERHGARPLAARGAGEALAIVASDSPLLILCDIGMPDLDGYELLQRLRQFSAAPAIALTAFARPEDRQRALDTGFIAHVAKPAEPAGLLAACARALQPQPSR